MKKITAIVLAAGLSRRMLSINKLLYPPTDPILLRVVQSLPAERLQEIIVVTGFEASKIKDLLADVPVRFIHNPHFQSGMASSLRTGIKGITTPVDGALICLGDMPDLERSDYERVINAFEEEHVTMVVPTWHGRKGHPVLFATEHFAQIIDMQNADQGARSIIDNTPGHNQLHIAMQSGACLSDYDTSNDFENKERSKRPT